MWADVRGRLVSVFLKKPYMIKIMILGVLRIATKFHFKDEEEV